MNLEKSKIKNILVDVVSLSSGGGYNHIYALISAHIKSNTKIVVILCGPPSILGRLPDGKNVIKKPLIQLPNFLKFIYPILLYFKILIECPDVLFLPATNYPFRYKKIVSLPQNMLPFSPKERDRFKYSFRWLRYILLFYIQRKVLSQSSHIIYLSKFAQKEINHYLTRPVPSRIIPHGVNLPQVHNFYRNCSSRDNKISISFVYVSPITAYKHQLLVIEAFSYLREKYGMDIKIDFIGPGVFPPSLSKFLEAKHQHDPHSAWCTYHGWVNNSELIEKISSYDFAVFASSCENFPITLLELMAAGLPIVASNIEPNIEILGDDAFYFDFNVESLSNAVLQAVSSPDRCSEVEKNNIGKLKNYTWEAAYNATIDVLTGE